MTDKAEGITDNIAAWLTEGEQRDVRALYDELERRYGPSSPTNYCAQLFYDMESLRCSAR